MVEPKLVLVLASLIIGINCHGASNNNLVKGGYPLVNPTVGEIWPTPHSIMSQETFMVVRPSTFSFNIVGHNCSILAEGINRYLDIMFGSKKISKKQLKYAKKPWKKNPSFRAYLDQVDINVLTDCSKAFPDANMDEQYEIKVDAPDSPNTASIISQSVWGALHGLESFSQLLIPDGAAFNVHSTQLLDHPRYAYRGFMLDTSRHFLPIETIKEHLDLMAMNKFNVFHWHIVDAQSFPYQSQVFPDLSGKGAYTQQHIYTLDQIKDVVAYASVRGLRVIPEFDTPGHTDAWGIGQPGLLTPCCDSEGKPDGTYGPVDPSNAENYDFISKLFTEVSTNAFSDKYLHLGGDEVDFGCWKSNPNITAFMTAQGFPGDYSKLEGYYIAQVINITKNLPNKNSYVVWQEVFDNGVVLDPETVVHIWKGEEKDELAKVTAAGFKTILSSCWYLNYISYGVDWHQYYQCDPEDFQGNDTQKRLVMGGEGCMWGEYVDWTNLIPRTWPRASVVAEKLWSPVEKTNSTDAATPRLEEHRCRLLSRGYPVEPLWPSYCENEFS